MRRFLVLLALTAATPALAQQQPQPASPPAQQRAPALPGAKPAAKSEAPGPVSRNAPVNGVLTLFGNERCPTNTDGAEVVVCVRRSAQEQFRIPKELREFEVTPENAAWAAKAQNTLDAGVGVSSIGSCSVVGPGGQSGCMAAAARANRAERKAQAKVNNPDY